ncbi:MAG: hypothetical protein ACRD5B_10810, partial [Nitrososphaeraceae archaeon]
MTNQRLDLHYMTVGSSAAERIVDDILSFNPEILSAGVIDRSGNIIANKSSESFGKRFEGVHNLEHNRYSGTLAVAALGVASEVKDAFGEPQAIITIYRDCKLMLLPMPSYDVLIGLALEPSANVENNTFVKEIERLVARTLK